VSPSSPPGVNAELPGGTGVNSGLGNAPIWANGERDTSNSFLLNGVDASNLFNGKSTSQVASGRVVSSTGNGNDGAGGVIQSSSSIYLSIGNALPTPAPESIQEIRVNASMYDAQQGSTSGAHIDLSTSSGTNDYHGNLYVHRGTNWLNAAPFFFKQDDDVPANDKVPQLHRYILGGTVGGPIIKDKLFGFLAYQHLHVSDAEIGDSFFDVPVGLTDDRSPQTLTAITNAEIWELRLPEASTRSRSPCSIRPRSRASPANGSYRMRRTSLLLLRIRITHSFPARPTLSRPGRSQPRLQRHQQGHAGPQVLLSARSHDRSLRLFQRSRLHPTSRRRFAGLLHQQHVSGQIQPQHAGDPGLHTGKIYSTNEQAFGPSNIPGGSYPSASIDTFGSTYFPGVSIVDVLGDFKVPGTNDTLNIGPNATSQGSNTGVFQNRLQPSGNAIWTRGKHTVQLRRQL
jgi:hypothetical protein